MDIHFEYIPSPKQSLFHSNPTKYRLYGGSVGGGKTMALCMEALQLSIDFPGNKGLIARKRFQDLRKTTMETFFRFVPKDIISEHNRSEAWVKLVNGSFIQFSDLEDPNKIKSMDLGWFAIDEATDASYSDFQMLKSRLRFSSTAPKENWKCVRRKGKIFYIPRYCGIMASNPEPGWVKDIFIDGLESQTKAPLKYPNLYSFTKSLPTDNPYNDDEYIRDLRDNDPEWVKKYVEGNWTTFKGQIYKDFNKDIHVREFEVDWHWNLYRTIDYGVEDPTVCLWIGVDKKGTVYIFDEYYSAKQNATTSEHVERILMQYPRGKYEFMGTVGDSHALGKQLIIDSREYGLKVMAVKPHKIVEGIDRVKKQLKLLGGQPILIIHPRCTNTIREFENYRWRERAGGNDLNQTNVPLDASNHCMDSLKNYFMTFGVSRPRERRPQDDVFIPRVSNLTGY